MSEKSKNPDKYFLKQYVDDRVARSEKHVLALMDLRVESLKESTDITKNALEIRLAGMNEFRDSLKDQSALMYTRAEHIIYAAKIDEAIDELKEAMHLARGKAEQSSVTMALAISLTGVLIGVMSLILSIFKG